MKIYLDMDGVLADFEKGVKDVCRFLPTSKNEKIMWELLSMEDHFYYSLSFMPGAKEAFRILYKKYGNSLEILSAIPKPNKNIKNTEVDKRNWIRDKLSPEVKVNIVYREDKINFCSPDSILIDDREDTVNSWIQNGGIGIVHIDWEQTLNLLKNNWKEGD